MSARRLMSLVTIALISTTLVNPGSAVAQTTGRYISIVSGDSFNCGLTAQGGVECWGDNMFGQLGDGTTRDRHTPVSVFGLGSGVVAIAAGYAHACAALATGTAQCWGYNVLGQLGNGNTANAQPTPSMVVGLSDVVTLALGQSFSCALTAFGEVKCWGANSSYQLGAGDAGLKVDSNGYHYSPKPIAVAGLPDGVTAIAAADDTACAVDRVGGVNCWGGNTDDSLGVGTYPSMTKRATPAPPVGLTSGISEVVLGMNHGCALSNDGLVKCWGADRTALGRQATPHVVDGLEGYSIAGIAAGLEHTCAVTSAGVALCWGNDEYGQVGDGTTRVPEDVAPPSVVGGLPEVVQLSLGAWHSCALTLAATVACWGLDHDGQLGILQDEIELQCRTLGHVPCYSLTPLDLATAPSLMREDGWINTSAMHAPRSSASATLLQDGSVMIAGGTDPSTGPVATSELYDPSNGTWSATRDMLVPRTSHTATLLTNGLVLVAGGYSGYPGGYLASAELYDPVTKRWTTTGSMSTPRFGHTATLLPDGRVLVVGGGGATSLGSAEIYDPLSGTWSPTGSMAEARRSHTATLLADGRVFIAGGGFSAFQLLASAEIFDPSAGTWTSAGNMSFGRQQHTATLLADGDVLVAGGFTNVAPGTLQSAELYHVGTGSWVTVPPMRYARGSHSATLLPSGQVLVAGGRSNTYLATTELYDPYSESWSLGARMSAGRLSHTATLLGNGRVLVAAGTGWPVNDPSSPLDFGELYYAETPPPAVVQMGPQAMEGALSVAPGDVLSAGFVFTVPGSHPFGAVTFVHPRFEFRGRCVTGAASALLALEGDDVRYADPAGSSAWYPSGNQHDSSTFQASITVPDLCGDGGLISLRDGGVFTTAVYSTIGNKISVRWHYSARGSSGSWSGTASYIPTVVADY